MATPNKLPHRFGKYSFPNSSLDSALKVQRPSFVWSGLAQKCVPRSRRATALSRAMQGTEIAVKTAQTKQLLLNRSKRAVLYVIKGAGTEILMSTSKCMVDVHCDEYACKTPYVTVYQQGGTSIELRRGGTVNGPILGCRVRNVRQRHCKTAAVRLDVTQPPNQIVMQAASEMLQPTVIPVAARLQGQTHSRRQSRALLMPYHITEQRFVCSHCRKFFDSAAEFAKHDQWDVGPNPALFRLYPSGHMTPFYCPKKSNAKTWKTGALEHIEAGRPDEAAKLAPTLVRYGAAASLRQKLCVLLSK